MSGGANLPEILDWRSMADAGSQWTPWRELIDSTIACIWVASNQVCIK
jgi:hypothetical protein